MGKRWAPEEKKYLVDHFETAATVEELAEVLDRPVLGVRKKAAELGLCRPDLHEVAIKRLLSAMDDTPRSSAEIAHRLNIARSNVNKVRIGQSSGSS